MDERADELVDHTGLRGRANSPQQELAGGGVVPGGRRPLGYELKRQAALRQSEPRVEARVDVSKPARIVAIRRTPVSGVVARGREGRRRNGPPNVQARKSRGLPQQRIAVRRRGSSRGYGEQATNDNCNELLHGTSYRHGARRATGGIPPVESCLVPLPAIQNG